MGTLAPKSTAIVPTPMATSAILAKLILQSVRVRPRTLSIVERNARKTPTAPLATPALQVSGRRSAPMVGLAYPLISRPKFARLIANTQRGIRVHRLGLARGQEHTNQDDERCFVLRC